MSLANRNITSTDISSNGVISQPDKLTGTASQNKSVFDKLIQDIVAVKHNGIITDLTASTGATEIGAATTGITGDTVQEILDALKGLIDVLDGDAIKMISQSLTEEQKAQARDNIGVTSAEVAVNSVNGRTGAVVLFTDLTATLTAGATSLSISNAIITTTKTYELYTEKYGVAPKTVTVEDGRMTFTFKAQANNMGVKVRIF